MSFWNGTSERIVNRLVRTSLYWHHLEPWVTEISHMISHNCDITCDIELQHLMEVDYDITVNLWYHTMISYVSKSQLYITQWYHIWYPNHHSMISHMISQLCDITVCLWYHSLTMISHVISYMYIMWCSSTSHVMSCMMSQCDVTEKTLWHHM